MRWAGACAGVGDRCAGALHGDGWRGQPGEGVGRAQVPADARLLQPRARRAAGHQPARPPRRRLRPECAGAVVFSACWDCISPLFLH